MNASTLARQISSGTGGRTSSQIAAKLPLSWCILAGRAMNHQWRCSPPSPQRQTCTRPTSPIDRTARSILASSTPSSPGELVGEVAWLGKVLARLQHRDERQPGGAEGLDPPPVVRPEVRVVRGLAARALDAACANPGRLVGGRLERAGLHGAGERPGVPLLDGGRAQCVPGTLVELLGSLSHCGPRHTRRGRTT